VGLRGDDVEERVKQNTRIGLCGICEHQMRPVGPPQAGVWIGTNEGFNEGRGLGCRAQDKDGRGRRV
jgi:hypothetical protein